MKTIAGDGKEYYSSTLLSQITGQPNGITPLDASGLIPSSLLVNRVHLAHSHANGSLGGTVIAESLNQTVIASGLYSYVSVTPYGSNGGQRNMYIDSLSQISPNTKIIVSLDSTYSEDIEFHITVPTTW